MHNIKNIAIIGDGGWGTTLAIYLAKKKYRVSLWGAFEDNIRRIKSKWVNSKFLPGIKVPKNVKATADLNEATSNADLIVLAVPSQFAGKVLRQMKLLDIRTKPFLSVVKGIDTRTLMRISQTIHKELGNVHLAVLSGPTIAMEVARGIPSTAVIASHNKILAKALQKVFNSKSFRIYTNDDVTGLELGGSLKNIIAIACGVCDGLGYGTNTKAAILTRGLVEMSRLGVALGAKQNTFYGLAGLGDLTTTCFSPQSRNRGVGEQLGKGRSIRAITSSMNAVAEGVESVKGVYKLGKKKKIDLPISNEVYKILWNNKKPAKAVSDLMGRKTKSE